MSTTTPQASRSARLWAVLSAWALTLRPARAQTRPRPERATPGRLGLLTATQVAAELGGLAAFAVAGFLVSAVVGCVVLGVVLLVVGNVRFS